MTVNSQITDAVADGDPHQVAAQKAGQVYQAIAQSMAIAIQDATDALRNITGIATTAAGVAISQILHTDHTAGEPEWLLQLKSAAQNAKVPAPSLASSPAVSAAWRMLAEAEADDVSYRLRTAIDATSASFESLGMAVTNELLRLLQVVATTVCVKAMLAEPEKASSYEEVLRVIKGIV